jgi:uncharacterized membrane protein YbhN (UPF0104 family)
VVAFRTVFCQKMSWRTSTEIGLSELAANSLFALGGAGGLALGAWILRRGGVSTGHIARRTVAFFLLTSFANVALLVVGGVALATGVLSGAPSLAYGIVPALVGIAGIGLALAAKPVAANLAHWTDRPRVETALRHLADGVAEAVMLLRTREPAVAIGTFGYVVFDVAMLGVSFTAFGNPLPPIGVLLLAYLIGQLGGLIPIPGGIGGVDGGLIGTLVIYGVEPADAAVAVIAYRGLLLAIPAVLGLPALAIIRRRLRTEQHDIAACSPGGEVEVLGRGPVRVGLPVTSGAAGRRG